MKMNKNLLFLLSLNSCALALVTEPDEFAKREMVKSYDHNNYCSKNNSHTCYDKPHRRKVMFKLKDNSILNQLDSSSDAQRTRAVTELLYQNENDPETISKLESMVVKDKSKWVRRASVKALAKLSGKGSLSTLKIAKEDKDRWVRHSATEALKNLR